jgi:hypothetical protein
MAKINIQNGEDLAHEYDHLKKIDMVPVRADILEKCSITKDVFYNWIGSRTEIPALAKPILNEIFQERQNSYFLALSDEK